MTTTITSQHNPRLKELRKLHRARERAASGLFLAEGEDLVTAAQAAGREAVEGFRTPDARAGDHAFHTVAPEALSSSSTLSSGTRAIGVYRQRYTTPIGPLCVYLHAVGDPGNVGAVLRSAHAFGASCVALGPDCADPHSPKAVRASMGSIFALALARVQDPLAELPGQRVALVAHGGQPLWDLPVQGPLTLLVGSERDGLPPELVASCEHAANIPVAAESLNAAMAATVALYETTRHSSRVPGR